MEEYIFARHCRENKSVCKREISVGSVAYTAEALRLSAGEWVKVEISVPLNSILEVEELHAREDGVFAYSIFLKTDNSNETEIYFRNYEPCADAPNGFFVRLPEKSAEGKITLIFSCETGTVYLHKLYVHDAAVLREYSTPMLAGFFTPKLYKGQPEKTVSEINSLCAPFKDNACMIPAVAFEIPYMNRTDRQITETVKDWIDVSRRTGTPLFLNLNSWWGATPGGPDGKGGYFGDAEYQQIVFDPSSGQYSLTVPNMWSNTPWLTMNHPVLNKARRERLSHTVQLINILLAHESVNSPFPPVSIFLDNEPAYWAAFAYGGDPDAGGDFSPFLLDAAARDGVTFQKGEALCDRRREWLLHNMNRYIDDLACVCREQTAQAPIIINNGELYPCRFIGDRIYTHVFPFAGYPYMDTKHPQWETHVTPFARLGIESSTTEDSRIFDYISRMGSFGNINAERACMHDYEFFTQNYAYGADICMIFNYRDGDSQNVADKASGWYTLEIKERDYPLEKIDIDVFKDGMTHPAIVRSENISVCGYRNRRVLRPSNIGSGKLIINAGRKSDYGDTLTVELWAFSHKDNGSITAAVGKTPECSDAAVYIPDHGNEGSPVLVDLCLSEFEARDTVWLTVEITSDSFDRDWCRINYIWHIRLMSRHRKKAGHTNGFSFTAAELRCLNRISEHRADRLLKLSCNCSAESFYLINNGVLGNTGISAECDSPVFLRSENSQSGIMLSVFGKPRTKIMLSDSRAENVGENRWLIRKSNSKAVLEITERKIPPLIKGRFVNFCGNMLRIEPDNPAAENWQPYIELELSDCCMLRMKKNYENDFIKTEPKEVPKGSFAEAVYRNGKVVSVDFTVFEISGTVTEVSPTKPFYKLKNTEIAIAVEKGIFKASVGRECVLAYSGTPSKCISGCPDADPGLTPGQHITVRYTLCADADILPRAVYITDFKEKE